jgi:hypothetical protein
MAKIDFLPLLNHKYGLSTILFPFFCVPNNIFKTSYLSSWFLLFCPLFFKQPQAKGWECSLVIKYLLSMYRPWVLSPAPQNNNKNLTLVKHIPIRQQFNKGKNKIPCYPRSFLEILSHLVPTLIPNHLYLQHWGFSGPTFKHLVLQC